VGVLRVEVGDSGVGIPAENHGRVFGEFTQFNRNQLQGGGNPSPSAHPLITTSLYFLVVGGSGLGLWISRKIIHMHKVDRYCIMASSSALQGSYTSVGVVTCA